MKRFLSLTAVLLLAVPLAAQAEAELKAADHKKLGKPFGDWVDAKVEGDASGASEAMVDLDKAMEKLGKKLKGRSPLSLVRDWEAVLSTGRKFDKSGKMIKKGKVLEREVSGFGSYLVWLPAAYRPDKVSYPTILLLDADPDATLETMPNEIKNEFIIIAPKVGEIDPADALGQESRYLVLVPVGECSSNYRVDRTRLFLVGNGEHGVGMASAYASILPHFFAGAAMVGADIPDVPGKANFKLMHVEKRENLSDTGEWLRGLEPINHYPESFEVDLVEPWMGRAFWVQARNFDTGEAVPEGKVARLKVSVDRGTNTITIDGEYVYQVMLYLNDVIVDLDKPITVLRNGDTYTFQASRSLGTLLENFASSQDGSVFPAMLRQLDMPTESKENADG
ncbi:MAG: alpha/beta hydrolase family protein [Planctomycetota bacterium]|jgi:hypothetical protein